LSIATGETFSCSGWRYIGKIGTCGNFTSRYTLASIYSKLIFHYSKRKRRSKMPGKAQKQEESSSLNLSIPGGHIDLLKYIKADFLQG